MALSTVNDYITEAAALCQDVGWVRYPQQRYVTGLNAGLAEAYRLRPDLFYGLTAPPTYEIGNINDVVAIPTWYCQPLLLYIVGHVELTDNQGNEDTRAGSLMALYTTKLKGPG